MFRQVGIFCYSLILTMILTVTLAELAVAQNLQPKAGFEALAYFDETNSFSFEEVQTLPDSAFVKVNHNRFTEGYAYGAYWFRIKFDKALKHKENYYLEVDHAYLDSLTYYFQDKEGEWQTTYAGNMVSMSEQLYTHYHFLFPLSHQSGVENLAYLKVNSRSSVHVPIKLWTQQAFWHNHTKSLTLYGLLYGALIFMFLYHFTVAVTLKSRTYLLFALFLFFNAVFQSIYYGHFRQFIYPEGGELLGILLLLTLAGLKSSALLFTRFFLKIPKKNFWGKFLRYMAMFWALLVVVSFVLPYPVSGTLFATYSTLSIIAILVVAFVTLKSNRYRARLFIIAWFLYLIGGALSDFRVLGFNLVPGYTDLLLQVGNILNALLLALALADRINRYRNAQFEAKQQALEVLTRQKVLVEEHRNTLEIRVVERTAALEEKREEIQEQNSKLQDQQKIIERQYGELEALNGELERKVQQRTFELRTSNKDLLKRKQQLEQFAYITSHNLRGPVASMIGLVKLFDAENLANPENKVYLDMLDRSVNKLDGVLKDLDKILKLEKNYDGQLEEVCYKDLVQGIFENLQVQVAEVRPELKVDFQEACIHGHHAYLESIWYNLLSNAIKYRNPTERLVLKLCSWATDECHCFSVEDNGLGMNLPELEGKLFSLYQRFHPGYAEGKGLGLYMLKSQVDLLKGKVAVESKKGQGTKFTVSLPKV